MEVFIALIVVILSVVLFGPYLLDTYRRRKKIAEAIDSFPGPKWYPIVGTVASMIFLSRKDAWNYEKKLYKDYGPTFRHWAFFRPLLFITELEDMETIFKSNVNINKAEAYFPLMPWLGEGLVTAHGQKWKQHRRLLTGAFHFKILDTYSEVFSRKASELVKILEGKVGEGYFNIAPYLTNCALDIISETAMGVKFNSLNNTSEYANSIFGICEIAAKRLVNPFQQTDFMFYLTSSGKRFKTYLETVEETNMKIIKDRSAEFKKITPQTEDDLGRKEKLAFLDLLLSNRAENKFTDKEIADEVNTFMFAGQDTTSGTVTYTLLALGNYPEIQEKVHEELDSIFGKEDRPVTPQDLTKMEYLERVIKETLRKFSFIPQVARDVEEEIVIGGRRIPPGVTIVISLYELHHNPEIWPDPDRFDPDRFLPENSSKRHPYAYAPFSAGSRNCIGQKFGMRNSKTMLATILRKFNVKCQEDPEKIQEYAEIILKPQNGLHIKLELRTKYYC